MPTAPIIDIVTRIAERTATLRPTEQKVARRILADLPMASAASIADLATAAGVSTASVTRFAKAMGCVDVRELKRWLAHASAIGARFMDGASTKADSHGRKRQEKDNSADLIQHDIVRTLHANRALINLGTMRKAARLLRDARMIYVFGMGGTSTFLADEARFRFMRFGLPVATYQDAVLQRMVAATTDDRCVIVVFSVTGQVAEVLASVTVAHEYGATVIAITAVGSPLAALADVLLPVQALETDDVLKPSSSRYAMLMALDVLAMVVAQLDRAHSHEALRRIKYVLDAQRGGDERQPLGD